MPVAKVLLRVLLPGALVLSVAGPVSAGDASAPRKPVDKVAASAKTSTAATTTAGRSPTKVLPARAASSPPAAKPAKAAPDRADLTTGSLAAGDVGDTVPSSAAYSAFVARLWPLAKGRGVSRATFDQAFAGVDPDPKVVELTRKQAEFVKPVWSYLQSAASEQRIRRGMEQAGAWADTLGEVEARTGVPRWVVLGVWGMETNFGSFTGGKDVIRSLATLAAIGYRGSFFRDELLAALVILQQRHVAREDMKGSWAGAMGQTQFMPTSFMRFAVDGDGDGHKDIWTSVPDALASTANYLRRNGWKPGLPWGFEVVLPKGFDWQLAKADFARWAAHGVHRADGAPMPHGGEASLFLPAGAHGPVFLVTANFGVIKRYNNSDSYALGVAHLGDRLAGGGPIRAEWPLDDGPLDRAQRIELQRRLSALGHDVGPADGRLGPRARDALRDVQARHGEIPDGYAGQGALQMLRALR